jgi:hypothetical protein
MQFIAKEQSPPYKVYKVSMVIPLTAKENMALELKVI